MKLLSQQIIDAAAAGKVSKATSLTLADLFPTARYVSLGMSQGNQICFSLNLLQPGNLWRCTSALSNSLLRLSLDALNTPYSQQAIQMEYQPNPFGCFQSGCLFDVDFAKQRCGCDSILSVPLTPKLSSAAASASGECSGVLQLGFSSSVDCSVRCVSLACAFAQCLLEELQTLMPSKKLVTGSSTPPLFGLAGSTSVAPEPAQLAQSANTFTEESLGGAIDGHFERAWQNEIDCDAQHPDWYELHFDQAFDEAYIEIMWGSDSSAGNAQRTTDDISTVCTSYAEGGTCSCTTVWRDGKGDVNTQSEKVLKDEMLSQGTVKQGTKILKRLGEVGTVQDDLQCTAMERLMTRVMTAAFFLIVVRWVTFLATVWKVPGSW